MKNILQSNQIYFKYGPQSIMITIRAIIFALFRICIIAEDKSKLFAASNWSVGVSLREWTHKKKPKETSAPRDGSSQDATASTNQTTSAESAIANSAAVNNECNTANDTGLDNNNYY